VTAPVSPSATPRRRARRRSKPRSARVHGEDGAPQRVIPRELVAQAMRQRQHPLADRHGTQDRIDEVCGAFGHAAAPATGTHPTFARKRDQALGVARVASKASEAPGPDAACNEVAELPLDEGRQAVAAGALGGGAEKGGEMLAHDLVEHGVLGEPTSILRVGAPNV